MWKNKNVGNSYNSLIYHGHKENFINTQMMKSLNYNNSGLNFPSEINKRVVLNKSMLGGFHVRVVLLPVETVF